MRGTSVRLNKGKSNTLYFVIVILCLCLTFLILFVLFDILLEATGQGSEGVQARKVSSREGLRINQSFERVVARGVWF